VDLLNQLYATHGPQYLSLRTDTVASRTTFNAFPSEWRTIFWVILWTLHSKLNLVKTF